MEDDLKWKTTSITKSRISQQLLVPYFPNFKLKLKLSNISKDNFKWKMTSNGRLPEILKGEYFSNYWSDPSHI